MQTRPAQLTWDDQCLAIVWDDGTTGAHLVASRPVFRHDHTGTLVQVSFNDADRAPFLPPHDEMVALHDALRAFEALANDRRLCGAYLNHEDFESHLRLAGLG